MEDSTKEYRPARDELNLMYDPHNEPLEIFYAIPLSPHNTGYIIQAGAEDIFIGAFLIIPSEGEMETPIHIVKSIHGALVFMNFAHAVNFIGRLFPADLISLGLPPLHVVEVGMKAVDGELTIWRIHRT